MGCKNSSNILETTPIKQNEESSYIYQLHTEPRSHLGVNELKYNYRISESTKVLGAGQFGKVFLSESIADPSFKVAIKVLNKVKLKEHIDSIREEVKILTKLDHPNIIKYYETYDDVKYIYMVMEYCSGGELFDKILAQKNSFFSETGTPLFMAPEVFDGDYNEKCDIWSLGILLYCLVSGLLPFIGDTAGEVMRKIKKGKISLKPKEFQNVTNECKDLINKMLTFDSYYRISGKDVLKHPWFMIFDQQILLTTQINDKSLDENILNNLRKFRGVSTLRKAVMNILVKMASNEHIEYLREAFIDLDKDSSGFITAAQLKQALINAKIYIKDDEIEKIINEVDFNGAKQINYSEFLAATISVKKIITEEKFQAIFKQFDTDGSGFITRQNIAEAMIKIGHKVSGQEIDDIMNKHDITKNGIISQKEFREIFMSCSNITQSQ
ncbi:protein kinase domain containing protein [Stylonychia lemnae]|uniref:non-specific serine/threonine protein kinase n=1 Tax=Stylonychia lemnae TaxID=5949 RepID=A0A078AZZ7_STYLE|nr:protein kinase domain containing protein [Stylonychia lemnae]|eukprot:CDW86363.1 protein kinase domain containing protein [Stylonychia lemnae]